MKSKVLSLLSIIVMVCVLIVMILPIAPVSAGALSWSIPEVIPSSTDKVIETSNINDYVVASDGMTFYAVLTGNKLYKSIDGGK